ncbi:c-type cytochrome [Pseudooceanicola aestuarii]|uniref:c-type cytochrome n=1 Tax=Pseudooceanicola aestuarii TaxID=2697319 RepID=UPI0013D4EB53|nr:cytochrome c [Pseudooceanicola aestuarii]
MKTIVAAAALAGLTFASAAQAASHMDRATAGAIKARQGLMQMYAMNLGILGAMAKEEVAFDPAVASRAASDLHALSDIDQTGLWVEGSGNDALGDATRALPAIWENPEDFDAAIAAMTEAASDMQAAAGQDLATLQGAMRGIGGACGACHKEFRQSN